MSPRANTLGIIYRDNQILLEENEGNHIRGNGFYYRPISGTIEHGEKSSETIKREFYEELATDIEVRSYITCLENIFELEGRIGHEITQIYEVVFNDLSLYQKDSFRVVEGNRVTYAKWIQLEDLFNGKKLLYPEELINYL